MDRKRAIERLSGAYVTVPTIFRDEDLELDLPAVRAHVRFLLHCAVAPFVALDSIRRSGPKHETDSRATFGCS